MIELLVFWSESKGNYRVWIQSKTRMLLNYLIKRASIQKQLLAGALQSSCSGKFVNVSGKHWWRRLANFRKVGLINIKRIRKHCNSILLKLACI